MTDHPARKLSTSGESLYATLGIPKTSTKDEIKRKYRQLALKYHPDKNPNNPAAAETFKDVNKANSILMDEEKRAIYDQHGSLGLYIADQFGESGVNYFFMMNSCWCKSLCLFCCVITGCYFCCCFFCCCCNFCCGKCKPRTPEDGEYEKCFDDDATDGEEPTVNSDEVITEKPSSSKPIVMQPSASPEKPAAIPLPPPSASETTNLNTSAQPSYDTSKSPEVEKS